METAVALVQAYLQVNGYFTVAEYPVLEARRHGGTRAATDLDILAFRFPKAGCEIDRGKRRARGPVVLEVDPELGASGESTDMIVGEVKEGKAHFNPAMRDPLVLGAALLRFGCCPPETVSKVVKTILQKGRASTSTGHQVRMIAFGSAASGTQEHHRVITMGHMIEFLRRYLHQHWSYLGKTQLTQPALAFLALMEKADRGHRDVVIAGERQGS